MNVDSRGIKRGRCMAPTCGCVSYSGGDSGMKCIGCGHPPGKHHNLFSLPPSGSQASSTLGSTSHTYAQAAILPTSGQNDGYPSPSYHSGGSYGHGDPYSPLHTHSHHHYPQPPSTRPLCGANGCTNPVHWEPDVGSFDYCSPECRNKHLLPIYKDQLLSDLKELTDQLQTDAVADTSDEYKTASSGATGKGQKQKTVSVYLKKTTGMDPGFIFHEELYHSSGLVITGVVVGSAAYQLMQNDQIRFLDVIEEVNGLPLSSLQRPFAEAVKYLSSVKMLIKRPISLPSTSKFISNTIKLNLSPSPTHILVLKHSSNFGLTCDLHMHSHSLCVISSSKDTPARQCGLQYGDTIQLFATATSEKIGNLQRCFGTASDKSQFERALFEAATNGQSLILMIVRRPATAS